MSLGGLSCSSFGKRLYMYRQKTHSSSFYVGYCVQLGRFCPQEQQRVTQQLGKLHQSNTGVPQKQFQQVCLVDVMMCFTCKILCNRLHKSCLLMTCYYQFHASKRSCLIRESVDSLCRDGADAQYMQYLSKSRITSPQTRKKLI